ncbi:hypothetical protein [Streptomyces sp. SID8352]|uniref:hypothetical protein n=1 Tax=Streptomyces sp. SID8352 TaxID=2690338 RepID=UPI00136F4AB1|nr:hypothetical protein [Streptomyces sp. SID8352]MYU20782.1 hypothetical protein [Streptomyces sp. SID8352]
MTAFVFAVAAALAVGYTAGRIKPCTRASHWAHWLFVGTTRPSRRDPRWWLAQAVFLGEIAVLLGTRPRQTLHAWKHRNDPPPGRGPALKIAPEWAAEADRPRGVGA